MGTIEAFMKYLFLDILVTFKCFFSEQRKTYFSYNHIFFFSSLCFLSPDDNCRLSDYRRLKSKILDLHDKRYTGSNIHQAHKDSMTARKQLVDMMFKRFDGDNNGQIHASELSQVRILNRMRYLKDFKKSMHTFTGRSVNYWHEGQKQQFNLESS